MIRRLYEGGLDPSARDLRREPGYREAMANLLEAEKHLRKSLSMEQCSALEKLSAAYIELQKIGARSAFADGFSIGVQLTAEALRRF